jgi:uncharacterized protein (UPF0332 family)
LLDELLKTSVNLRLEKARECLTAAEQTIGLNSFATAANRSYYCIFHALRAVLITVGFSVKKHSGNISEFQRLFIKTKTFPDAFSDIITNAFSVRNKSDYDDYYVVSKEEVLTQTANAKTFLEAVEKYISTQ